ncbi:helix-turn-helix domain-containing protein [Chryseobacterium sp. G0186]|uniref:helix-turn-helix domain-containing protein n=1 Tax=Chryseobacterium sp. G0186 TaxID=2487064 RepID=UPI000F4DFB88|nr:helix-turn-helix domain-containing protein [Chryseobacterium sp. G0186]AZA78683.1 helix-turn-helix domain-containing protein [Chryseobacterium sp. G0186]
MNLSEKNIPVHNLVSEEFQVSTLEAGHPEKFEDVHRHSFFEIIWFKEVQSESRLEVDFESYTVRNNDVCIIAPGQVFNMKLKGEKGHVLAISKDIFREICNIETVFISGAKPFLLELPDESARSIISLIEQEYNKDARIDLLKAYLKAFFIVITSGLSIEDSSLRDKQRFQQLVKLVEKYYIEEQNTSFYAEQLKISTHHLNDIVRLSRATTVKRMISQRLILEAKRELSFGALTIKEIAFRLGFNDTSYFSRFFKKHTGQTPDYFKNKAKE